MWIYLLTALGVSLAINVLLFLVAFRRGTDKLTDASYAVSFIALAAYALAQAPVTPFRTLLFVMITLWAVRLGGFLLFRIWHTGRDSRFDAMRGNFWQFGKFWVSQGLAVWVILIPSLLALRTEQAIITGGAVLGLAIWVVGVIIEATADLQKYRFNTRPANKNKWITSGLWRYSRHPNYLGEMLVWLGVYVCAATALGLAPALVGLVSPLFICTLLLFISGIPILEKSADARWGKLPEYQTYKKRTSLLLLLPPKKL